MHPRNSSAMWMRMASIFLLFNPILGYPASEYPQMDQQNFLERPQSDQSGYRDREFRYGTSNFNRDPVTIPEHGPLELVDNGYEGLVIAITEDVPQDHCNHVIHGLKVKTIMIIKYFLFNIA